MVAAHGSQLVQALVAKNKNKECEEVEVRRAVIEIRGVRNDILKKTTNFWSDDKKNRERCCICFCTHRRAGPSPVVPTLISVYRSLFREKSHSCI